MVRFICLSNGLRVINTLYDQGTYSRYSSSSCTACEPGKYNDEEGASSCTKCAAGKLSNSSGATACEKCSPGRYQSFTGNTKCEKASAGHYVSDSGSSTYQTCVSPSTSDAGATICSLCVADYYHHPGKACKDIDDDTVCETEILEGGNCMVCPGLCSSLIVPVNTQRSCVFSDGAECDRAGTTIRKLFIKQGYYRFSTDDHHVYECMFPDMCRGSSSNITFESPSNVTFESRCREGSGGPECGVCKRDFYFSTSFERCEPCSDATSNSTLFILGISCMLLLALVVWLLLSPALLRRFLRPRFVNLASNLVHWFSQLWSESLVAQVKIIWTGDSPGTMYLH